MKTSTAAFAFAVALASTPAYAVDWTKVTGKDVMMLYPGQSSFEWVMTPADHSGGVKIREGKNCHECHTGEENTMGDTLVSGKKNEPTPIAGKPGSVKATIKFAHDDKNLYVHLDFAPGVQPNAKMDNDFETKVTMILNDGGVPESNRFGCWGACHDDAQAMPSGTGSERTKYLGKTRQKVSRQGGGDALKSPEELAALKASGYSLEYWQARLNPGAKAVAAAGTIFDKREEIKSPAVTADATLADGTWSVTLSRPLAAGAPYKDIAAGKTYTVGFAIHAGHTAHRFHYVSMERTMVLDSGAGDFVAAKQ